MSKNIFLFILEKIAEFAKKNLLAASRRQAKNASGSEQDKKMNVSPKKNASSARHLPRDSLSFRSLRPMLISILFLQFF